MATVAERRVEWVGGPLDGCKALISLPARTWVGPDPTDPKDSVIIYYLHSDSTYRFDQKATNEANRRNSRE